MPTPSQSAIRKGVKKQRRDETKADFVVRVRKTFPASIRAARANIETVARMYSLDTKLLLAITAKDKKCTDAYTAARAKEAQKKYEADDLMGEVRRVEEKKDSRLIRKSWPVDPDEKEASVSDALMVSLIENEGNVVEVGLCLNLPTYYILEMIEASDELQLQKERGRLNFVARAENELMKNVEAGNMTAIKVFLTNRAADEWSDKQSVTVNHTGFKPPEENDEGVSVLTLINGDKKNA